MEVLNFMNELLIKYKNRWYLFLLCIIFSWLSLAISFYSPILFSLAIGFMFSDVILFVMSLILFGLLAPLPVHILNLKLVKKGASGKLLFLSSFVMAVIIFFIAIASFMLLSDNFDFRAGFGFGFYVSIFVVLFWVLSLLAFVIYMLIKGIKSFKKNGSIVMVFLILSALTACNSNIGSDLTLDSRWNTSNFTPLSTDFSENTPHGYLSVPLIRHMNDYFYERAAFTYRELETAAWIVEELLAMGYTWNDIEIQEFSWYDFGFHSWLEYGRFNGGFIYFILGWIYSANQIISTRFFSDQEHRAGLISQNIILTIPGATDEFIVIGAHYDTLLFPGANDNASGVALLLESARRMMYQDNHYTLVYVFFGAEEVGLLGSRYFMYGLTDADHENLLFMVNADGLIGGVLLYSAGFDDNGTPGANAITSQIDCIANNISNYYDIEFLTWPWGIYALTDHIPFIWAGHTIVWLASGNAYIAIGDDEIDNWSFINETFPGMIERNMRGFSIFLENILLSKW